MQDDINVALGLAENSRDLKDLKNEESSLACIERVRDHTCYSTLRNLNAFFSVLCCIGIVISALVCVVRGIQLENDLSALLVFISIAGGVLGVFIVTAYHQASTLLIDIADNLIEQNRKKNIDNSQSV